MLFLFYVYGDHRDLHSFPTRRSSDLKAPEPELSIAAEGEAKAPARPRNLYAFVKQAWKNPRSGVVKETHFARLVEWRDRKSTRLNSSHQIISYAVFCLKKKKKKHINI